LPRMNKGISHGFSVLRWPGTRGTGELQLMMDLQK
jgi:hypothetical protein